MTTEKKKTREKTYIEIFFENLKIIIKKMEDKKQDLNIIFEWNKNGHDLLIENGNVAILVEGVDYFCHITENFCFDVSEIKKLDTKKIYLTGDPDKKNIEIGTHGKNITVGLSKINDKPHLFRRVEKLFSLLDNLQKDDSTTILCDPKFLGVLDIFEQVQIHNYKNFLFAKTNNSHDPANVFSFAKILIAKLQN